VLAATAVSVAVVHVRAHVVCNIGTLRLSTAQPAIIQVVSHIILRQICLSEGHHMTCLGSNDEAEVASCSE